MLKRSMPGPTRMSVNFVSSFNKFNLLVDFDVKSELEVVYADIEDPKVAEFLQNFMNDLTVNFSSISSLI